MITEDILEWISTLPKWQQKLSYAIVEKRHISEELLNEIYTYYYRAKEWCELLRESWERAVEEILFNDAIQRYNPCVQTQRLRKAPFSHELYEELECGMTECSSWCHDQARAINGNVPNADELKRYIECFELYCKQYKAK